MTDRLLPELGRSAARRAFGAARALALLSGVTSSAVAQPSPAPTPTPAPVSAPAPTPAGAAAAAPAPAVTAPAPPPPATDEDDEQTATGARVPDSDASPEAPAPAVPPNALATTTPVTPAPPPAADVNQIDDGRMGTHQEHWLLGVGLRETFVTSKGYDPFSTDNVLPQVSLELGRAFHASGPFSLAGMFIWDYGSTKATARQADTSLVVHRLTAGAEGRYHLIRRWYVFGRVAPGALHSQATLDDQVVGLDRRSNAWLFTSDFSLGTGFEFASDPRGASTRPRGWVGAEGGYAWAASTKIEFKDVASSSQAPARLESLRFEDLALRGAFFRLSATLTY